MALNIVHTLIQSYLLGGEMRPGAEVAVQYVDHNLVQGDHLNAEEHLFLRSACRRFGVWYSRPGNGISHPVHMARFGVRGKLLLGSDSHTPAAGSPSAPPRASRSGLHGSRHPPKRMA